METSSGDTMAVTATKKGRGPRSLSSTMMTVVFINIGLAALVAFALFQYGSLGAALAHLRGDPLVPDSYSKSVGDIREGVNVSFRLTNTTRKPIELLGANTSCTCTVVSGLPVTIPAGGAYLLGVTVNPKEDVKPADARIRIFTDLPDHRYMDLKIFRNRNTFKLF
jgi:hypothetical protein